MSIVIAVIDRDLKNLYFYGDKRRTVRSFDGTISRSDDYTKIFKLKDDLFIGFTGIAEIGIQYLSVLLNISDKDSDSILDLAAQIRTPLINTPSGAIGCNVIIAGKNNDGRLFIWTRIGNSSPQYFCNLSPGSIIYSISTSDIGRDIAEPTLKHCIMKNKLSHIDRSIEETIKITSNFDESISPIFDSFKLSIC